VSGLQSSEPPKTKESEVKKSENAPKPQNVIVIDDD